jgi:ankyrin repeat protein
MSFEEFKSYIDSNDVKNVESMLNSIDPTLNNNYAIRTASENGYAEIVRLLLKDGRADPANNNNDPIKRASSRGRTEVVRLLLEDGR